MHDEYVKALAELEWIAHSTAINTSMLTLNFGTSFYVPFNAIMYKHMKAMLEELIDDSKTDIC